MTIHRFTSRHLRAEILPLHFAPTVKSHHHPLHQWSGSQPVMVHFALCLGIQNIALCDGSWIDWTARKMPKERKRPPRYLKFALIFWQSFSDGSQQLIVSDGKFVNGLGVTDLSTN